MIISTTESIPGRTIKRFFGVVSGSTVRSKHIGRDLMAGIKNIFGGELKGYTELLQESREDGSARTPWRSPPRACRAPAAGPRRTAPRGTAPSPTPPATTIPLASVKNVSGAGWLGRSPSSRYTRGVPLWENEPKKSSNSRRTMWLASGRGR